MGEPQKVSFITVNYNGLSDTLELIQSIHQNSYNNIEIIVVDNNSAINPEPEIIGKFPDVKIIQSKSNLGFAGGNNLGISMATGDFLFFINNDTVITDGCIEKLISSFENQDNIGGISPMILYFEQPNIIQFAGFTPINKITGRNSTIGESEIDNQQYNKVYQIPYLHGAAMMISKKVVDEVGMMPDFFFLYYEELDWSCRIRDKGYNLLFQPEAKIYHKESISVGKNSPIKVFYINRNRIWFMKRNFSSFQYFIFLIYFSVIAMPKNLFSYLIQGDFKNFWAFVAAYISGVQNGVNKSVRI